VPETQTHLWALVSYAVAPKWGSGVQFGANTFIREHLGSAVRHLQFRGMAFSVTLRRKLRIAVYSRHEGSFCPALRNLRYTTNLIRAATNYWRAINALNVDMGSMPETAYRLAKASVDLRYAGPHVNIIKSSLPQAPIGEERPRGSSGSPSASPSKSLTRTGGPGGVRA
jgi:hypothetical protein